MTIRRRAIDPDPVVLCDPELIYQVALNLLVNAVQILPDGGSIEIAILPVRDGYAGFEVRDDGPGMTEEVAPGSSSRTSHVVRAEQDWSHVRSASRAGAPWPSFGGERDRPWYGLSRHSSGCRDFPMTGLFKDM